MFEHHKNDQSLCLSLVPFYPWDHRFWWLHFWEWKPCWAKNESLSPHRQPGGWCQGANVKLEREEKSRGSISCATGLEFNKRDIKWRGICLDTAGFFNIRHHAWFPWKWVSNLNLELFGKGRVHFFCFFNQRHFSSRSKWKGDLSLRKNVANFPV